MKVSLSDQEAFGLWGFMQGPVWGNTDDTLLAQLELWDALKLDTRFAVLSKETKFSELSTTPADAELSPAAVTLLRSYLARPAQPVHLGIASARALKRLNDAKHD